MGYMSNLVSGVGNFANKIGSGLSGLVQLPGAMLASGQAANQASNAANAAAGKSYTPNYNGAYNGQGILGSAITSRMSGTATNTNTTKPLVSTGTGTGTGNAPVVQPDPNAAAANTYSGGVSGTGQTFPGYVSALSGTAAGATQPYIQNQGNVQTAQTGLLNSIPQNSPLIQKANQNLQDLQNNYADQSGIIGNSPVGLSEQGGEQGLLNTQYAGKLSAAQTGVTNALAANTQTQNAYNEAGGLANTAASNATGQQGTQQSGQAAAAGLASPQAGQNPATQSYNPLTGQYSGLAGLSAGGNSGQTAQQALATIGQTLGGETAGANLVPLQQALAAGQGASDNITSYLQQNPDLNSSTLNLGNLAAQWASGQYSGANAAKYQTLGNYLTTFATQMAPLLAPGGTATDAARALQQSLVNGSANNQTIQQVLAQLTAEAKGTLANRTSGAGGGGAVSSGSSVTSVPGGTNPVVEGTTQSAGGNNYVYTNGKWTVK